MADIYHPVNPKLIWLILWPIVLGLVCVFLPWYLAVISSVFLVLLIALTCKLRWWAYILIFLTPVCLKGPGFVMDSVGSSGISKEPLPITFILPVIAVLILILHKSLKLHKDKIKNPLFVPILIFVCYILSTFFWSPAEVSVNLYYLVYLVSNICLFYFLFHTIDSEAFHKRIMWCVIFLGVALCIQVFVVRYDIINFDAVSFKLSDWLLVNLLHKSPRVQAGSGFFAGPAGTAATLDIIIFVAMGLLLTLKSKAKICFLWITIVMCFFALFFTGNKGGSWAAVMMTFVFLLISQKRRKNFFRNAIIYFCLILMVFVVGMRLRKSRRSTTYGRMGKISTEQGTSLGQRFLYWEEGFKQLDERSLAPLGLGIGGYTDVNALRISQPHNLYFHMFFDFGFVGIIFICSVIVILTRMFLNIVNYQETYLQNMSIALAAGLCCVGLTGLVSTTYYSATVWFMLALTCSTFCLVQKELSGEKSLNKEISDK